MTGKQFILIIAGLSFVAWIGGNAVLGPPGFSRAYLAEYQDDHDGYLDIVKTEAYKKYRQRPHLHGPGTPDAPPNLAAQIEFVNAYTNRGAYLDERRRQRWYELYFHGLNAFWLVLIVGYFAREPIAGFLDGQIGRVLEEVRAAEAELDAAKARRERAQGHVDGLPDEAAQIAENAERLIARELQAMRAAHADRLDILQRELDDRKRQEHHLAALRLKQDMVNVAIGQIIEEYRTSQSEERQAALIEEFAAELEQQA